jgi:gamma-butyrobetaine dioxygenase
VGDPIQVLADLFAFEGGREYFGEPVTQAEHMLQAAARARLAWASPPLIAAALLHDIGHFLGPISGAELMAGTDNRHSDVGADWLAEWFPPAVTEPVRLHVAAKRYLCAVDPRYLAELSEASRFTLTVQGGPMSDSEVGGFEALPYAQDAVRLRRWDEAAKDPSATPAPFDFYRPLLGRLVLDLY